MESPSWRCVDPGRIRKIPYYRYGVLEKLDIEPWGKKKKKKKNRVNVNLDTLPHEGLPCLFIYLSACEGSYMNRARPDCNLGQSSVEHAISSFGSFHMGASTKGASGIKGRATKISDPELN